MWNTGAIAFGEVATQKTADYRAPDAKDHESNAAHYPACEVRKQEESNPGIHQNRQYNS
jgi:hypothetical protein